MHSQGITRLCHATLRGAGLACALAASAAGCTSLLGIDGNYVTETVAAGSGGHGGSAGGAGGSSASSDSGEGGSGGSTDSGLSSGGAGGGNQGGAAGACTDASTCGVGEKCCNGSCVDPSPLTGCTMTDCTPCPQSLPHTDPLCVQGQCTARCSDGYVPYGGACVLESSLDGSVSAGGAGGGGGAGGTGGSAGTSGGGTGGVCYPPACPLCTDPLVGIAQCCGTTTNRCGCTWFGPAYCR